MATPASNIHTFALSQKGFDEAHGVVVGDVVVHGVRQEDVLAAVEALDMIGHSGLLLRTGLPSHGLSVRTR